MKQNLNIGTTPSSRRRYQGFTIVELITIIAIVGFVMAIGAPVIVRNREEAQRMTCIQNLRAIDAAKEQIAANNGLRNGDAILVEMVGVEYLKEMPKCPSSGEYSINPIGTNPSCTISEHSL